ncbi:MAG: hypothetical protein HQL58_04010 [Magnetococcales bacterium]|nr:hypothetical protein [Magnetococcales bacterium]
MKMNLLTPDFILRQRQKPTVAPIEPDKATALLAGRGEGRSADVSVPMTASEIQEKLQLLMTAARTERLEFALPLIEVIQMALALDHAASNTPPGTLTVKGWISLLNNWENQLRSLRRRQIGFSRDFFHEMTERIEFRNTPLVPMIQELVDMMAMAMAEKAEEVAEAQSQQRASVRVG